MPAESYRELVIKGDDEIVRGFLWGYMAAKLIKKGLIISRDHPISTPHLRDLLRYHHKCVHVLCLSTVHKPLVAAIKRSQAAGLEILTDRKVKRTRFDFAFETVNRKVGQNLKALFRRPPAGVALSAFEPHEELDPKAAEVELYTSVPDYRYYGKGTATGGIERLLQFYGKLDAHEFVDAKKIEIET